MTSRKNYIIKVALAFFFALILTLTLMSAAFATPLSIQTQNEPYRVDTFNVSTPGELNVKTSGGHITVKGTSTTKARIEMYVTKNGNNLLPEDIDLENWDIDVSQSGNSLQAIAKRKRSSGWKLFSSNNNPSISFVVYSPHEMSTDLKTSGGHISIRGLKGDQQISTSGGHLELADLDGSINARTSGGHIEISDTKGGLKARTSGGHIDAINSIGKLNVKTSGGHIKLTNIQGPVKASTSGGSITADLASIDQLVDLHTSGGNIDLSVPNNIGLDLDLRGSYVHTDLNNFSGEVERDEIKGKLNGGGPKVSAYTSGGTVSLYFN
ncbi:DUF4097 family beta strand repeat-containing protein [Fodinibius saliphilus]|uniref:DUF4097 family beta strand repeat-containing protein n=1 Tax=Fodinibius saliphilus TaxID=1920650 RepID=UPI0011095D4B|nr:DUF4097 family beta strand repeat-containing protein [Fodinibius saliphilus]